MADFGIRLAAYLIDSVVLAVIVGIVAVSAFFLVVPRIVASMPESGQVDGGQAVSGFLLPVLGLEAGLFLFVLVCWYLYTVELLVARDGQTLGKRIMKIRVVPIAPGARLTRGIAVKRYLVQSLAGTLVPFFPYVDGLWQLWDKPYQQTLHDKAAQTVVVKVSA